MKRKDTRRILAFCDFRDVAGNMEFHTSWWPATREGCFLRHTSLPVPAGAYVIYDGEDLHSIMLDINSDVSLLTLYEPKTGTEARVADLERVGAYIRKAVRDVYQNAREAGETNKKRAAEGKVAASG